MRKWRRKFRSLGHAFLEVLHAEVAALLEDFQRTGRGLVQGGLYLVAAAAFAFWSLGVLTVVAIAALALVLSLWQAAGVVFLLLLALTATLGFLGRRTLQRLRGPTAIVRGHVDDHVEWWRQNLQAETPALGPKARARSKAEADEDEEEDGEDLEP